MLAGGGALATLLLAACSGTSPSSPAGGPVAGVTSSVTADCPVAPVRVVVSVDQWGSIVRDLAGGCATVTTIITGSSGDPHEYEPSVGDIAAFAEADLVVVNGAGYDEWATKAVDALDRRPALVDAAAVAGRAAGDNPHVWYSPEIVERVAAAVTAALRDRRPEAASTFATAAERWTDTARPYLEAVRSLKADVGGRRYAATEPVVDDLAAAIGLVDVTPEGYRRASANEAEPAPGDVVAFVDLLRDRQVDVLVVNTQTEGAAPEQLRAEAEEAGVAIVEVSETVPDGATFLSWQLAQLAALRAALTRPPG